MAFNFGVFHFYKCETAFNFGVFSFSQAWNSVSFWNFFLWRRNVWCGTITNFVCFFFRSPCKLQKILGLRCNDLFFEITCFLFEIGVVKRQHHKAWAMAFSQKLQGIFQRLCGRWKVRENTGVKAAYKIMKKSMLATTASQKWLTFIKRFALTIKITRFLVHKHCMASSQVIDWKYLLQINRCPLYYYFFAHHNKNSGCSWYSNQWIMMAYLSDQWSFKSAA